MQAICAEKGGPTRAYTRHRTLVLGIGGAGCNIVSNIAASAPLIQADLGWANTDWPSLARDNPIISIRLKIGSTGHGSEGAAPDYGRTAALETEWDISSLFEQYELVCLAAGLGGGTGTGAAPVIAELAHRHGLAVRSVVTTPFAFEGVSRQHAAEAAITLLESFSTLRILANEDWAKDEKLTLDEIFRLADQRAAQSILASLPKHI